jgi:hypothetical protein
MRRIFGPKRDEPIRLSLVPKKPLRGKRFRSIEEVSNEVT